MRLLDRLNKVSPKRCRFLARKDGGRRPMTNDDIARASGLGRSTIAKLSKLDRWDSVSARTMQAFSAGCGIDLLAPSRRRDKRLICGGRLTLLENSSPAQRRMFKRLISDLRGNQHTERGLTA